MKTSNLTLVSAQSLVNLTKFYCHLISSVIILGLQMSLNEELCDISMNLRWTCSPCCIVQRKVLSSYDANTKTVEVTAGIAAKRETHDLSCQPA